MQSNIVFFFTVLSVFCGGVTGWFGSTNVLREWEDDTSPAQKAAYWLLSQWQNTTAWDDDSSRVLVALASTGSRVVKKKDVLLMTQQLTADLVFALMRNDSGTEVPLYQLAQYIRALTATCRDPERFYGRNLVEELRFRTSKILREDDSVPPSLILTLCLVNDTADDDAMSLFKTSDSRVNSDHIVKRYDLEAFSAIAAACMIQRSTRYRNGYNSTFFDRLNETVRSHERNIEEGDVYTTALLLQAINAWNFHPKISSLENQRKLLKKSLLSMQGEDGSFGDLLSTYYSMPAITGRSILNLHGLCSGGSAPFRTPGFGSRYITIEISLWITKNKVESNTIIYQVQSGSSLLDAMQLASLKNPLFKFKCDDTNHGKILYEVNGVPNDSEKNLYWLVYTNPTFTLKDIHSHSTSKKQGKIIGLNYVIPKDGEKFLFWYRVPGASSLPRM